MSSLKEYKRLLKDAKLNERVELFPVLFQRTPNMPFDSHYVHQSVWALRRITKIQPRQHVDVASNISFVAQLSVIVPVVYVELNPPRLQLPNLTLQSASATDMPFADRSLTSLSCLHVVEHVGLGRYGDSLDVHGPERVCRELTRCVAESGSLLISVPIGQRRIQYNAHRVFHPMEISEYTSELDLVEFSVVTDDGRFIEDTDPELYARLRYGCGLYWFRRPNSRVEKTT